MGVRNSLLLSIVNSMSTFGNNSLALTLALIVAVALAAYDEKPSWTLAALAVLSGLGIFGLSATLAFPLMLAAGSWVLLGKVRQWWRLVVAAAVIGAVGLPLLRATNVMGESSRHLQFSFDGGHFIQNVALGIAPICVLSLAGLSVRRRLSFWWLLFTACILVPTFVEIAGHGSLPSTMSMKTASLLVVAAAPLVADGLLALMFAAPSTWRTVQRAVAALVLLAGLANSLVYTFQFAGYRLTGRDRGRSADLPADYVQALDYVRRHTQPTAVVVDPNEDRLPDTIGTLLIAERQVWLPAASVTERFFPNHDNAEIASRPDLWRAWEKGGFTEEALAATIARQADILVGPPHIQSASWEERYAVGDYAVYAARRPPGR